MPEPGIVFPTVHDGNDMAVSVKLRLTAAVMFPTHDVAVEREPVMTAIRFCSISDNEST